MRKEILDYTTEIVSVRHKIANYPGYFYEVINYRNISYIQSMCAKYNRIYSMTLTGIDKVIVMFDAM